MKIRYIILTILGTLLVVGGGLIYVGHNDRQAQTSDSTTSKAHSKTSAVKESISSSSSEKDVVTASGTDYKIVVATGLGGAFATPPTSITKILDDKTALDVIASIPNLNNYKLDSLNNGDNSWNAKITKDDNEYDISMTHYQDVLGAISVSKNGERYEVYSFNIPENLYAPYRGLDQNQTTNSSSESSSNNDLTEDEAVNLANKYVTGSTGANTEPFKFNTKNGDTYYLKTDIKKGTDGTPDVATYATVELQDNDNVHITAGVWTSTMASHAPFYDKVVPR